ncbi:GldG family protein [Cocleimonas sp. KMM 6892]|uniref:GldG family protein n=1 Tax=unclassified Cocleimonas TaxID=2639732 RepID=UPI002DBA2002|nr:MULTISPECIES: GldG family protein [unclassified Cocleimonas]MEB8431664.1 GldG family protein [Cocleimonas sp. KMM 6892]MEC4713564.1 GldG family protein [Cocleimonas sp. KMM 6895]MEC4742895.1 GldG family protein [Cocleimonas sp. KMM 6896]
MSNKSHIALRIQNVIFSVLFVVIIGLLAWLGKTYHKGFDATQTQRNSLSQTTQELLKRIDKPILLTAYVPDDAVVHTNLRQLIDKYKKYNDNIKLEIINPDLDPARAKQDGIDYSGQLLVRLGENSEKVNSVDEQTMLDVLQRLSRTEPRLVVFVEGHNERSPYSDKSTGMSNLAKVLEQKGFLLQPHNILRTQSLPQNASFVVLAAPQKEFLEGEVKIIAEYLKQGGNLLWLHEPGSLHGLDNIEQQLGLEMNEGTLLDANTALQEMLGIQHPAAIAIIDYGPSALTTKLAAHTLFPFATPIERDESIKSRDPENGPKVGGWQYQPLLTTLPTSWMESGDIQGNVKFDDDADKPGPLDIAMALTRDVDLSDEASPSETDDDEKEAKQAMQNKQIKEQRVLVVGDSDFMLNSYIGQGSNLELASNIFNWLSVDDDLLSIKAKVAPGTSLNLSTAGRIGLAVLWLGLPLLLLLIGTLRWHKRRKR